MILHCSQSQYAGEALQEVYQPNSVDLRLKFPSAPSPRHNASYNMSLSRRTRGHSRPESASLISVAVVVGAICLSITDAVPGGLDGALGFVLGFAIALIVLGAVRLANIREIQLMKLTQSQKRMISEIAVRSTSGLTKGSSSAEWK